MPYNDFICARTGRHYSTYEQLQECRKQCQSCPYDNQVRKSHSKREDTLSADDIDRLFKIGKYSKPTTREEKIKANINWSTVDISGKHKSVQPYQRIKKEYSSSVKVTANLIMILLVLLVIGVIGGIIYGIIEFHDEAWNGIMLGYHWVADHITNVVHSIQSNTNAPQIETVNAPITTSTGVPTSNPTTLTSAAKPNDNDQDYYADMFNEYRQEHGLVPLIFTDDLNKIAQLRLAELRNDYSHNSVGGYNSHLGENIVWYSGTLTNTRAINSWKSSPEHNANMLDTSYKYTGYAIGKNYAVQVFSSYETINGEPQLPEGWYFSD